MKHCQHLQYSKETHHFLLSTQTFSRSVRERQTGFQTISSLSFWLNFQPTLGDELLWICEVCGVPKNGPLVDGDSCLFIPIRYTLNSIVCTYSSRNPHPINLTSSLWHYSRQMTRSRWWVNPQSLLHNCIQILALQKLS